MIYTYANKNHKKVKDLVFMKILSKFETLPILCFKQNGSYVIAVTVPKPKRKVYFIKSSTIDGMKAIFRYFKLKLESGKLNKKLFKENYK